MAPSPVEAVDDEDPTPAFGPYTIPLDRYAHLPKRTRRFIETLDEEDITALGDFLLQYKRARTIGWFFKWLIAGAAALFMATIALGEAISKSAVWLGKILGKS